MQMGGKERLIILESSVLVEFSVLSVGLSGLYGKSDVFLFACRRSLFPISQSPL